MWDVGSGKLVRDVFRGADVRSINFSDDGSRIAVVSNSEIHIFSGALGERLSVLPMPHGGADTAAFTPGGETLLSLDKGRGEVFAWNVSAGNRRDAGDLANLAEVISGHVVDDQGAAISDSQHYARVRAMKEQLAARATKTSTSPVSQLMSFFRYRSNLAADLARLLFADPGSRGETR
jgi:hypothetical protein